MSDKSAASFVSGCRTFSKGASIIIALGGVMVLIGWVFNIPLLKSVHPSLVAMKANTALNFLLIGISLWLLQEKKPTQSPNRFTRRIAQVCACLVTLIGLLSLSEYLFGWNLGIDQLLFKEPLGAVGTSHPGRMAPNTAVNFSIIGIALLLLDVESRRGQRPSQWLILVEGIISFIALTGYTYGVKPLYGPIAAYTVMALHTAVLFNIICLGILFSRPDKGLMKLLTTESLGGMTLRRLLLPAIGILFAVDLLKVAGEKAKIYDSFTGTAIFTVIRIIIFVVLIWVTSRLLHRVDSQRRQAEEEAQKAKEIAETATRAKSEFLANMSHELRTPLNAVIGFSEVLYDQKFGPLNEIQRDYLNDILESGKLLLSLINDILDLAKIESGKMELALSAFSLKELLKHSLVFIKEKALKHNIELSLDIAEEVGYIRADERKVKQIIFNLLSNAAKFTPDDGKIGIKAKIIGSEAAVTVWDAGIGISKEDQNKLFSEFMQLENPLTKEYKGSGLGLSLTKKLVELHGGHIWVESEGKGKGSSFNFSLPIKRGE